MPRDLLAELEPQDLFVGKSKPRDLLASVPQEDYLLTEARKSPETLSRMIGTTPAELEAQGKWIKGGLLQTGEDIYREGISPLMSGASTFAGGIPKMVAAAQGEKEAVFPEQRTLPGKALRLGSEIAGFTAGLPGKAATFTGKAIGKGAEMLPKFFGKTLATRVAQGAGAGAAGFGLAGDTLESRKETAKMGATIGGAIPIAGAAGKGIGGFISKSGRWVAKNIGGITDATVATIKRLGADRVFEPAKAQIDYLGNVVAPKAQARILDAITNFTDKSQGILKALGVKSEAISKLKEISPQTRTQLRQMVGEGTEDIGASLTQFKEAAGRQFQEALPPNAQINVSGSMSSLKNALEKQGWIDVRGQELQGAGIANKTKATLVKILQYYSKIDNEGKMLAKGAAPLTSRQYLNLLSELDAAVSGNPKFDRFVFEAQDNLRQTAAKQIPALAKASETYADAMRLLESQKTFEKLDNVVNLENKLLSLKNVAKGQLHDQWKKILGTDLYDDVLAHLSNQDFELVSSKPGAGGGFYPSRAGLRKATIGRGTKAYYKNIAPQLEKAKTVTGKFIGQPVKRLGEKSGLVW